MRGLLRRIVAAFPASRRRAEAPPQAPAETEASRRAPTAESQDLEIYWTPEFAEMLEHWGEENVWREVRFLVAPLSGPILDIACGTGRVMGILTADLDKDVYGCDISEFLLARARERGIPPSRLFAEDASRMSFSRGQFAHAYSIGSLEHFTEDGIGRVLRECRRVVRHETLHMVPVSRSGRDEGWLKAQQSYHNNSVRWWLERYRAAYPVVHVLDSEWSDALSVGKWFVCSRE